jgi:hypothetical protein
MDLVRSLPGMMSFMGTSLVLGFTTKKAVLFQGLCLRAVCCRLVFIGGWCRIGPVVLDARLSEEVRTCYAISSLDGW